MKIAIRTLRLAERHLHVDSQLLHLHRTKTLAQGNSTEHNLYPKGRSSLCCGEMLRCDVPLRGQNMKLPSLSFALSLLGFQQASTSSNDTASLQQRASLARERYRQEAIQLNGLAGRIHSDADALALVNKIAGVFADTLPPAWVTANIRHRLAPRPGPRTH
jgi:hypothetical protein